MGGRESQGFIVAETGTSSPDSTSVPGSTTSEASDSSLLWNIAVSLLSRQHKRNIAVKYPPELYGFPAGHLVAPSLLGSVHQPMLGVGGLGIHIGGHSNNARLSNRGSANATASGSRLTPTHISQANSGRQDAIAAHFPPMLSLVQRTGRCGNAVPPPTLNRPVGPPHTLLERVSSVDPPTGTRFMRIQLEVLPPTIGGLKNSAPAMRNKFGHPVHCIEDTDDGEHLVVRAAIRRHGARFTSTYEDAWPRTHSCLTTRHGHIIDEAMEGDFTPDSDSTETVTSGGEPESSDEDDEDENMPEAPLLPSAMPTATTSATSTSVSALFTLPTPRALAPQAAVSALPALPTRCALSTQPTVRAQSLQEFGMPVDHSPIGLGEVER
ncbi:hypothetical protein B0H14DRAFT_3155202 [Mycena olivaceomarginata]|nr:hypothetical protein B0H14DRAFT_3155202 [Mycena olivaceomarginata]